MNLSWAKVFWRSKPHGLAKLKSEELVDFLIGVIKRSAPITKPSDLADDLARHAREANPPYNGFTGVAEDEEANLMKPYYEGLDQYR
jgi:hypothetical protein